MVSPSVTLSVREVEEVAAVVQSAGQVAGYFHSLGFDVIAGDPTLKAVGQGFLDDLLAKLNALAD